MKTILALMLMTGPVLALAETPKKGSAEEEAFRKQMNDALKPKTKESIEADKKAAEAKPVPRETTPPVPGEDGKLKQAKGYGVKVDEVISETEVTGWQAWSGRTGTRAFFRFEKSHGLATTEKAKARDWADGGTIKHRGQVFRVWVEVPGTTEKYKWAK